MGSCIKIATFCVPSPFNTPDFAMIHASPSHPSPRYTQAWHGSWCVHPKGTGCAPDDHYYGGERHGTGCRVLSYQPHGMHSSASALPCCDQRTSPAECDPAVSSHQKFTRASFKQVHTRTDEIRSTSPQRPYLELLSRPPPSPPSRHVTTRGTNQRDSRANLRRRASDRRGHDGPGHSGQATL